MLCHSRISWISSATTGELSSCLARWRNIFWSEIRLFFFMHTYQSLFFTNQLCIHTHTHTNVNTTGVLQIVQLDAIQGIGKQSLAALYVISLPITSFLQGATCTHCYLLLGNDVIFDTDYRLLHYYSWKACTGRCGERCAGEGKMTVRKWKAEDGSSVISFWRRGNGCSLNIYLKLYLEYCIGITLKKVIALFLGTSRTAITLIIICSSYI